MKTSSLLAVARDRALPVVAAISDDQLGLPTPCAEYTVADLLDHLLHVVVEFQELAVKRDADFSSTPRYPDWRARFPVETEALVQAWATPGADVGVTGLMALPATTVGAMALLDLTVHAWDLARATGQDFTPDQDVVDAVAKLVAEIGPMARESKVFGEPLDVAAHASPVESLIAATGRDPGWSAG
ncbi:TIGR03086 family metal-binding protein [Streptoalloteichus hindustanus]|uniref:TIGR03086 family protein n=1 Tax=Streptoalloteichus hindustanus TaxID=2017 RepID=A0A1M4U0X0_STRHI|nr:TIGR03086 family metal-binding protein [Streptoalloteichus hindustanus]SHE50412.1 TIGR03086 family protein [Streptoalloteichus hindustanus]